MKRSILLLMFASLPLFFYGQTSAIQQLIDGKICDTCIIQKHIQTGNTLEYAFIGGYFNSGRQHNDLSDLKKSIPEARYEQRCYITKDSVITIAFIDDATRPKKNSAQSFLWEEGFDYKNIQVSVTLNNSTLLSAVPMTALKPAKDFLFNKISYDQETGEEKLKGPRNNYSIGSLALKTGDLVIVTLYNTRLKKTELSLNIKRIFERPSNFVYYETPIGSADLKDNLQSFLSATIQKENVSFGDSSAVFSIKKGNLGVFNFNSLEADEVIEYRLSGDDHWKPVKRPKFSPFEEKVYIIIDNKDIPPGKTRTLTFRYKDLPGSAYTVTIAGVEPHNQIAWLKITGIFILAGLIFGGWYFFRRKQDKKQIKKLNLRNQDIETRLSLLSGQLNPHFLFNALHAIQGTINSKNPEQANAYIGKVAAFMRDVMDNGKKEFISLQEELKLERDYLELEQERKLFTYSIKIAEGIDIAQTDFPPLLLQPVLENSIRHAFTGHVAHPCLAIDVSQSYENLIIKVTDNGGAWDPNTAKEGHGIALTKKRIGVYNEKLTAMLIDMAIAYRNEQTITTFTFQNWLA